MGKTWSSHIMEVHLVKKEGNKKEQIQKKLPILEAFFYVCGVGRDRTGDTRIFSPLLYLLSYRTIPNSMFVLLEWSAKIELFF